MKADYFEQLSSNRTEALFVGLTLIYILLAVWRMNSSGYSTSTVILFLFCAFFLFYSINYRRLSIRITAELLELQFGLFTWKVPLDNVESCRLDETSLWRIGGAGIHFSPINGRYRAMFNFLEHPRVVIALKHRQGLVRDIAFSTRRPDEFIEKIRAASATLPASDPPL
jgi:hypothetical protein